jgi:hypothetical protein
MGQLSNKVQFLIFSTTLTIYIFLFLLQCEIIQQVQFLEIYIFWN